MKTTIENDLKTLQDYVSELIDEPTHYEFSVTHNIDITVEGIQHKSGVHMFETWEIAQDYCDRINRVIINPDFHYHVSPKLIQNH